MKRILVATDGSTGAERAILFAAELARSLGCELLIVNVIGGYGLPDGILKGLRGTESAWFGDLLAANSAEILQRAQAQVSALGIRSAILESRRGEAVLAVIDYAREQHADAIVIGKRGEGQLERLLLGSVSQKLVSLAPTVVMVVP